MSKSRYFMCCFKKSIELFSTAILQLYTCKNLGRGDKQCCLPPQYILLRTLFLDPELSFESVPIHKQRWPYLVLIKDFRVSHMEQLAWRQVSLSQYVSVPT